MGIADGAPEVVWGVAHAGLPRPDRIELLDGSGLLNRLERRAVWVGSKLTAAPADDLRGWHSLDVTCRIRRSAAEALDAISGVGAIEWGTRAHPSRLTIRGRRPRRASGRGPSLVDAVLRGRGTGELDLTIAVFAGNDTSCVVQLRRADRMPWGMRRRRRRMAATHEAADHLIDRVLAVDFRPPTSIAAGPF